MKLIYKIGVGICAVLAAGFFLQEKPAKPDQAFVADAHRLIRERISGDEMGIGQSAVFTRSEIVQAKEGEAAVCGVVRFKRDGRPSEVESRYWVGGVRRRDQTWAFAVNAVETAAKSDQAWQSKQRFCPRNVVPWFWEH
ncbi:hypothetical protein [Teichococcus aestuarii]|uniref:hypothetical protein n=1 Tax=Teichococcus aestuarii TaxID=568898 RepID=UPI0036188F98